MMINLNAEVKVIKDDEVFMTDAYRVAPYNNRIYFYIGGVIISSYHLNDIELIAEDGMIIIR